MTSLRTRSRPDCNDPGILIAVEGIDGSGKSTQIYLLKRWLELNGYRVFFTEWNSSALVKKSTKRGKKENLFTPTTFSLIHATDFADRYERQIHPLLRTGYIVLADRYMYTAFARDAGTPVCGGLFPHQLFQALQALRDLWFIGGDVMEIAPDLDHADMTSLLGAHILFEYMSLLAHGRA